MRSDRQIGIVLFACVFLFCFVWMYVSWVFFGGVGGGGKGGGVGTKQKTN